MGGVRKIIITRDEAEVAISCLEHNYSTGKFEHAGIGVELAVKLREAFGMPDQPEIKFKSANEEGISNA